MTEFVLNYKNKYEIDTTGNTDPTDLTKATWATLAAGISQVTPSFNETADTTEYYDGEGFGSNDITGKRLQLAFTGHRKQGDTAQDFIAGLALEVGDGLKTLFRWTQPDGSTIVGTVTLTAIVASGGNASAKQTFSFTAVFNGKPAYTKSGTSTPASGTTQG